MKRLIAFLLCICVVLPLFGCNQTEKPKKPVNFYYRRSIINYDQDDGVISPESRESQGHEEDINYLLTEYLKGPILNKYVQVFPDGTFLVSIHYMDDAAAVVLSAHLATLTGIDLTIACACITMTIIDLTGVETVQIYAANSLLGDYQSITMDKNCILLLDSGATSS